MTRETRIGLLVGLVFIVMFGLVLSGLTEKNPLTQSPQSASGDNRSAYINQTLPTIEELSPPPAIPPAVAATPPSPAGAARPIVSVAVLPNPTSPESGPVPPIHPSLDPTLRPDPDPVPAIVRGGTGAPPVPPVATIGDSRFDAPGAVVPPELPTVTTPGGRVYVVENKETFIAIARKFYGAEHVAEYKRIMDANKVKDPASLRAGMEITIPPLVAAPAARGAATPPTGTGVRPAGGATTRPAATGGTIPGTIRVPLRSDGALVAVGSGSRTPLTAPAPASAAGGGRTYVVQSGDTVAKIARRFLKDDSPASVAKIMKANRIDDARSLQTGVTLAIPS